MFKRKTLIVVGAGASDECRIPVGRDLATRMTVNAAQPCQDAADTIRDGLPLSYSIDDFLDLHENNEVIKTYGKAAIVKCILEAVDSKLKEPEQVFH